MDFFAWMYHHPYPEQDLMIHTFVILLRLSTINTKWTQRVISLMISPSQSPSMNTSDNNNNNNNINSSPSSPQMTVIQQLQMVIPARPIYEESELIADIRGGKELTKEEYLAVGKWCLSLPRWHHIGFAILRITNIVDLETIQQLLLPELQPSHIMQNRYYLVKEHLRYILHINSNLWRGQRDENNNNKEEEDQKDLLLYQQLHKQLLETLHCLKEQHHMLKRPNPNDQKVEYELIEQATLKLESI